MMFLTNWFNVYNVDHIRAYKIFLNTGDWPDGFLPENIQFKDQWQIILMSKMTEAWVKHADIVCPKN